MAEKESVRRTGDCRVKLAPSMMERLESLAELYGMPSATFAAFAIADYINRHETNQRMARMAVMDVSRQAGETLNLTDEQMEKVFGPMLAELAKQQALTQQNLPLDGEATKVA